MSDALHPGPDFENEADFENPAVVDRAVADGIRQALKRTDLTAEDRREFEEALERLKD